MDRVEFNYRANKWAKYLDDKPLSIDSDTRLGRIKSKCGGSDTVENEPLLREFDKVKRPLFPIFNQTKRIKLNQRSYVESSEQLTSPSKVNRNNDELVSTEIIPSKFRTVFQDFAYFNPMQSKIFEKVFKDDQTLVVCAPTGSGKTVLFELAIVVELIKFDKARRDYNSFKAVYIAPLKTLCHERYTDWHNKFSPFGLICTEVTGDTNYDKGVELTRANIVLTTPEKWDALTRSIEFQSTLRSTRLVLIDEVHLLNDTCRGPRLEALISRFKMIQKLKQDSLINFRFIAVSASAPNSSDIAEWLSDHENHVNNNSMNDRAIVLSDNYRSVKLEKKVFAYPCASSWNDFFFEATLNSKLGDVIVQYSGQKPTLVFVATRKSCYQTARKLAEGGTFLSNAYRIDVLKHLSSQLKDTKLKENLLKGIAYHHAGLSPGDRNNVEHYFAQGWIPVLISTSTLAQGVNLPAHLVVIKSTFHYVNGECVEYSESEISQMIGRAGRPQFSNYGIAIIMTKQQMETKYKRLISGSQTIESHLPKYLCECLNAEIVLQTVRSLSLALEWINLTFFSIRVRKDPSCYGMDKSWTNERINEKLRDMCMKELNGLKKYDLINMSDDGQNITSTQLGTLMALRSVQFDTMKRLVALNGSETLQQLLTIICKCEDVQSSVRLRVNEKRLLNTINLPSKSDQKIQKSIRYPVEGKIRSDDMKASVLIQAVFGDIEIDLSLTQDVHRIIRIGERISKCLAEVSLLQFKSFRLVLNCLILAKCFRAKMWENSRYVARQLPKIGSKLAETLVNINLDSFDEIEKCDPRKLEMISHRRPPYGRELIEAVKQIPRYSLGYSCQMKDKYEKAFVLNLKIELVNKDCVDAGKNHCCTLLVGDKNDNIILKRRISDKNLLMNQSCGVLVFNFELPDSPSIFIHLISDQYVGIDLSYEFFPEYQAAFSTGQFQPKLKRIHSIDSYYNAFIATTASPKKIDENRTERPKELIEEDDEFLKNLEIEI